MASKPVALILGAGPRIGAAVAQKFADDGFKVVTASRSGGNKNSAGDALQLKADFTKPDSVAALFDDIKKELGSAPSVIIYNAAAMTNPPEADSVLSVPAEKFVADLHVNTVSAYVAAQQAIAGWKTLPGETKKTFIYTGNALNEMIVPVPAMMDLGTGKSASAYWIGLADITYAERGIRFFYADERQPGGQVKGQELDGPAHADFYAQLARHEGNVPWHATFVKGQNYVKFS